MLKEIYVTTVHTAGGLIHKKCIVFYKLIISVVRKIIRGHGTL